MKTGCVKEHSSLNRGINVLLIVVSYILQFRPESGVDFLFLAFCFAASSVSPETTANNSPAKRRRSNILSFSANTHPSVLYVRTFDIKLLVKCDIPCSRPCMWCFPCGTMWYHVAPCGCVLCMVVVYVSAVPIQG